MERVVVQCVALPLCTSEGRKKISYSDRSFIILTPCVQGMARTLTYATVDVFMSYQLHYA